VVFAVRSICPLVAALLLLVKLVLRVPIPKISFWVKEEDDLGGAAEEQQGKDQALYTAASGGSSMMTRRTESDADTNASVSVRQSDDDSSCNGVRAADNDGGVVDVAAQGSLDLDAVEKGGVGAAGGGSADDSAVTDSRAASPVAVPGKAAGAAAVKESVADDGAKDSSSDWIPLLIGFAMCQVSGPARSHAPAMAAAACVCSCCLAWSCAQCTQQQWFGGQHRRWA
jgi:hypothetical protein